MDSSELDDSLPAPEEMLGWHRGGDVDINTTLEYFTAGTSQPIAFDNLYPVTYSFIPVERERSFGSYAGIDDFIGALPVKQMYNVYAGLFTGNHEFRHEYIFMLKWLRDSMEMSDIICSHLADRLNFLKIYLQYTQTKIKEHFKRYKDMKADGSVADETVYLHKKEGFHKKRGYDIFVYPSMAMTVINVFANQTDKPQWQQCQCTKCMYRRSPEWNRSKPDGIPLATLPPMRFYRRGSKGVSPSEEIYRKQREKNQ